MSGPTEHFENCRRAVITGLDTKPEWSELRDKLSFLKYAEITDENTQEHKYVVYAHAHPPMRKTGWMKLFPGVEVVEKVSQFEDCKLYRRLQRERLLSTLGEPLRHDVVREKKESTSIKDVTNKKRKAETDVLKHELNSLRIQKIELEQRGARHEHLDEMDAAILTREQQLQEAAAAFAAPLVPAAALAGMNGSLPVRP